MLLAPFPNTSSPFGEWPQWRQNMGLGPHRGLDFVCDEGDPIPASGRGVSVGRGYQSAIGYWVIIRYATELGDVYFGYCHLREESHLAYGMWVDAGNTVGIVGNTGTATTGAHLHLTASLDAGNPAYVAVVDPARYLTTSATAGGDGTPVNNTPAKPVDLKEYDMRVYANSEVEQAWRRGSEAKGTWDPIATGEPWLKAAGQDDVIRLTNVEFIAMAAFYRSGDGDTRVYAPIEGGAWRVVGPDVDYAIQPGEQGIFERTFGERVPVPRAELTRLREALAPAGV